MTGSGVTGRAGVKVVRLDRRVPLLVEQTFRWVEWVDAADDERPEDVARRWDEEPERLTLLPVEAAFNITCKIGLADHATALYSTGRKVGPTLPEGAWNVDQLRRIGVWRASNGQDMEHHAAALLVLRAAAEASP
jgi:hypothetical protein